MTPETLARLRDYAGFGPEDEAALRELYEHVRPRFDEVADDFYTRILAHPGTRRFIAGEQQVVRLKKALKGWLEELFTGRYDEAYCARRDRIGFIHVQVGLPNDYVVAAMSHIRRQLESAVIDHLGPGSPRLFGALESLHRALELELALISRAYYTAEKYRDLVEEAPEMIHELDAEGRLVSVNKTERRILGRPADDLLGLHVAELVPAEDREALGRHLRQALEKGSAHFETRLTPRGAEPIDVEFLTSRAQETATGSTRLRCYVRDVSERRRFARALREEHEKASKYLEVAAVLMVVLNTDGTVRLINRKGCEILGRREEEIIGRNWFDAFLPEDRRSELRRLFEQAVASGGPDLPVQWENPVLTAGGEERDVEWYNTVLTDEHGRVTAVISSGQDVTERKRLTRELMEKTSLARIGEMAAVVAHEVRNPLAGISGALQMIRSESSEEAGHVQIIDEILGRIQGLNDSVNDILLYARPRMPQVTQIPVLSTLRDTVDFLATDPQFSGLDMGVKGHDIMVRADPGLLKPVLLNLLVNAAQAMEGEGRIAVTIAAGEDGFCRITFADSGPGMPEEVRKRAFEPFFSTKHRGTGLGLPIAKRLIEAQGGGIHLTCPPEGGTVVEILLPRQEEESKAGRGSGPGS